MNGITIITPTFNSAATIAQCMESVACQLASSVLPIEHIIIDGDSQDNTISIVEKFALVNTHVRFLSEPDSGQSNAINKGLRIAKFNYVGLLNSDDSYLPGCFEVVSHFFVANPRVDLLVGNCLIYVASQNHEVTVKSPKVSYSNLLTMRHDDSFPPNPCSYFYRRTIHSVLGYYDEQDHYTMDLSFLIDLTRIASIQYIDFNFGCFNLTSSCKTYSIMSDGSIYKRKRQLCLHKLLMLPFSLSKLCFLLLFVLNTWFRDVVFWLSAKARSIFAVWF